jgi:hypothetical protein
VFRCSNMGCDDAPDAITGEAATGLAVHSGTVYWTANNGTVSMCAVSGCRVPTRVWSPTVSAIATGLAVDASGIYWASEPRGQILTCGIGGCTDHPKQLNPSDTQVAALGQVALDADNVYFVDRNPSPQGMILKCPKLGCDGASTVLASGLGSPAGIATDGLYVYWTEAGDYFVDGHAVANAGNVRKCAVDGCNNTPTTIAAGVSSPSGIAVDESFVYWADNPAGDRSGEIWMAPK